jgi:hypothetical protein
VHNSLSTLVFLIFGDKYESSDVFDEHIRIFFKCVSERGRMYRMVYFHGSLSDTWLGSGPVWLIKDILPAFLAKMVDFSFVGLNYYSSHVKSGLKS